MSVSFITSNRGDVLLVLDNFTFSKGRVLKSGEVCWRCSRKKLNCKAKVYTVGPDNIFSRNEGMHSHDADEQKLNRKIVSNLCKRTAQADISEKPSKLICKTLASNLPESLTTMDVNYIRKNIYNSRRRILPGPLPKTIEEVHKAVNIYCDTHLTSKGEHFLLVNDAKNNTIVFTCETNIRVLNSADIWYMDGTFSYCTKFFFQFFTIHVLQNGHYIPLVYCLLSSKTIQAYKTCFSLIKHNIFEKYQLLLNPNTIFVDFEKSIHTALLCIWPSVNISGCRFHLHQSWYRKIQSLGLISEYKAKTEIGKWLKTTFGLTYLSPDEVSDCFVFDLMSYKPENELVDKYCDYLLETYIEENALFPPSVWAEQSASVTRTTNACESFHAKFNSSFYSTHPSIYVFLEKLKECQIDTYVKIQSLHIPMKVKDKAVKSKLELLEKLVRNYNSGEINRLDYVKCTSYLSLHT